MHINTDLFTLIKSLSKQEKRYFKLYAEQNTRNNKNNYLLLFDVIEHQSRSSSGEYDEAKLLKEHKGAEFIKYFASTKYQLYNLILRVMHIYHSESSTDAILNEKIHHIEFLYNKALYKQSLKEVKQARQLAEDAEKFAHLLDIIGWEQKVMKEIPDLKKKNIDTDKWLKEERDVLHKLSNLTEYRKVFNDVHFLYKFKGHIRSSSEKEEYLKVIRQPLLKTEKNALSARALYMHYHSYGNYYSAQSDIQRCYVQTKIIVDFMEHKKSVFEDNLSYYVNTIYYFGVMSLLLKKTNDFWRVINKLQTTKANSEILKVKTFEWIYNLLFLYYTRSGNFQEGAKAVEEFEKGLSKYEGKMTKSIEVILYNQSGYINFGAGKYSQALKWVNKLLNSTTLNVRDDVKTMARILDLFIHYELGNEELILYKVRSNQRFLSKNNRMYGIERTIMSYFIKKSLYEKDHRKETFIELKKDIIEVIKNSKEESFLMHLDLLYWIDSKITGASFSDLLKKSFSSKNLSQ